MCRLVALLLLHRLPLPVTTVGPCHRLTSRPLCSQWVRESLFPRLQWKFSISSSLMRSAHSSLSRRICMHNKTCVIYFTHSGSPSLLVLPKQPTASPTERHSGTVGSVGFIFATLDIRPLTVSCSTTSSVCVCVCVCLCTCMFVRVLVFTCMLMYVGVSMFVCLRVCVYVFVQYACVYACV